MLPPAGSVEPWAGMQGLPVLGMAQDVVGQRLALRQQLEQMHQKRTGQLRAPDARWEGQGRSLWGGGSLLSLASGITSHSLPRNTQNFQQLLCPSGGEKPTPGEEHSSPVTTAESSKGWLKRWRLRKHKRATCRSEVISERPGTQPQSLEEPDTHRHTAASFHQVACDFFFHPEAHCLAVSEGHVPGVKRCEGPVLAEERFNAAHIAEQFFLHWGAWGKMSEARNGSWERHSHDSPAFPALGI